MSSWKLRARHSKTSVVGFTLIELLVVIGIIGILASILMPVLARGKLKAKRIVCINNLRQWGIAQNMYVNDNMDTYPRTKIPNGTPGAPPGYNEDNPTWTDLADFYFSTPQQGMDTWFNALPAYVAQKPLYYYSTSAGTSPLLGAQLFNSINTIFRCPMATIDPGKNPNINIAFQYGMNSKALDQTTAPWLKASMIASPSRFVLFSEGRTLIKETPFYGNTAKQTDICKPQVYTTDFSSRHEKGASIVFGDGHTAWYRYDYVCADDGAKAADPGHSEIQWAADGHRIP